MIQILGLIIGLYVITRYFEMGEKCGSIGKVWLAIMLFSTVFLLIKLMVLTP